MSKETKESKAETIASLPGIKITRVMFSEAVDFPSLGMEMGLNTTFKHKEVNLSFTPAGVRVMYKNHVVLVPSDNIIAVYE